MALSLSGWVVSAPMGPETWRMKSFVLSSFKACEPGDDNFVREPVNDDWNLRAMFSVDGPGAISHPCCGEWMCSASMEVESNISMNVVLASMNVTLNSMER